MNLLYETFKNQDLASKLTYFEDFFIENVRYADEKKLKTFLRNVFELEKSDYLRKLSLEASCSLVFTGKLNKHYILDVIYDIDNNEDPFVIQTSIKILLYLFDDDNEIINKIESFKNHLNSDVASEAYFRLGLIILLKNNSDLETKDFLVNLYKSKEFFSISSQLIENRVDAQFYFYLTDFLCSFIQKDQKKMESIFIALLNSLWIMRINHYDENLMQMEYKLYRILEDIKSIFVSISNLDGWIDFHSELSRISQYHCDLINTEIISNPFYQKYLSVLKSNINDRLLYPYYALNFLPQRKRIDNLLNDTVNDIETTTLLKHIKTIISNQESKKKHDITDDIISHSTKIKEIVPGIELKQIIEDLKDKNIPENSFNLLDIISQYVNQSYSRSAEFITGTHVGQEIFYRIQKELHYYIPEYPPLKFNKFLNVLENIISYVQSTVCSNKDDFLFLYDEKHGGKGSFALEKDLRDDLFTYLKRTRISHGIYLEEKDFAEGGRVDIVYRDSEVTFPIELKRTFEQITKENIRDNYLAQVQTYIYPYDQLGIFMLLDLHEKREFCYPSSSNNLRDLFYIDHLQPFYNIENKYPDYILVVIVQGNRILPSDRSKYSSKSK